MYICTAAHGGRVGTSLADGGSVGAPDSVDRGDYECGGGHGSSGGLVSENDGIRYSADGVSVLRQGLVTQEQMEGGGAEDGEGGGLEGGVKSPGVRFAEDQVSVAFLL